MLVILVHPLPNCLLRKRSKFRMTIESDLTFTLLLLTILYHFPTNTLKVGVHTLMAGCTCQSALLDGPLVRRRVISSCPTSPLRPGGRKHPISSRSYSPSIPTFIRKCSR